MKDPLKDLRVKESERKDTDEGRGSHAVVEEFDRQPIRDGKEVVPEDELQ